MATGFYKILDSSFYSSNPSTELQTKFFAHKDQVVLVDIRVTIYENKYKLNEIAIACRAAPAAAEEAAVSQDLSPSSWRPEHRKGGRQASSGDRTPTQCSTRLALFGS